MKKLERPFLDEGREAPQSLATEKQIAAHCSVAKISHVEKFFMGSGLTGFF